MLKRDNFLQIFATAKKVWSLLSTQKESIAAARTEKLGTHSLTHTHTLHRFSTRSGIGNLPCLHKVSACQACLPGTSSGKYCALFGILLSQNGVCGNASSNGKQLLLLLQGSKFKLAS